MVPKVIARGGGAATVTTRFFGWDRLHLIRVRIERRAGYIDLYGVGIGSFEIFWNNPFKGEE